MKHPTHAAPLYGALTVFYGALTVLLLTLLALAPVLAVRAAGSASARNASSATPARPMAQVTIQNFAFSPQTLTVKPGTKVVWTNRDSVAHTVTSDSGAWPDSGPIASGQTFAHTFGKPGTYAYHCHIHPSMTATVVVTMGGPMVGTGMMGSMGMMGPMSTMPITTFTGWYDDHKVLFLATDTSSKMEAMSQHINYSASLGKSLPHTVPMYMVTNGAFANRGAVFASEPGEDTYTPLWQEVMVTWKHPSQAVALGKDDQIKDLVKAGKLMLQMTTTVLNCPIIKVLAAPGSGTSSSSSSSSGY